MVRDICGYLVLFVLAFLVISWIIANDYVYYVRKIIYGFDDNKTIFYHKMRLCQAANWNWMWDRSRRDGVKRDCRPSELKNEACLENQDCCMSVTIVEDSALKR